MNEIELTLKLKVNTDTVLDDMAVRAIATAITDGMGTNVDENTIIDVKEMIATFQTTISLVDTPVLAQETEYDGQP